jgi:outer membrane scaffolding protein for murein synthesis (MipA/OmpV family)
MKNFVLGLIAIWPAVGLAQDAGLTQQRWLDSNDINFSVGLGVVGLSGVYEGQDDELLPFPLLTATYGPVTVDLTKGIDFRLWENHTTRLAAGVVYNGAPDLPDTALFDDLDRDDWIGGELSATRYFGVFDIALSGQVDLSDKHDGGNAELSVGRSFVLGRTLIEGRLGATYLDEKQGSYLYGVADDEANDLRAAYDVKESWTPHVDLSVFYGVTDNTSVGGFFRHEEFPDEIADSPLLDARERTTFGLTLVRTF